MTTTRIFNTVISAALLAASCASPDTSFVTEPGVMDPSCEDVEVWRAKLGVRASYTESDEISLHLEVDDGSLVEIDGAVSIDGAAIRAEYYDQTSLWLLLVPDDGITDIAIGGVLRCTLAEERFTVMLTLSPEEGAIEHSIEFGDIGDAGVGADGGET